MARASAMYARTAPVRAYTRARTAPARARTAPARAHARARTAPVRTRTRTAPARTRARATSGCATSARIRRLSGVALVRIFCMLICVLVCRSFASHGVYCVIYPTGQGAFVLNCYNKRKLRLSTNKPYSV